jgi:hypothetical protein
LTALLLAAAAAAGCSTVPQARPLPAGPGAAAAVTAEAPPWEVPAAAYGSQILYRVAVTGAEGEGSLKLTLRLASPARYQAQAVDPLGRAIWGLDADGDRGLWLDHRGHGYCRLAGAMDLAFLPLGPLSLSALPPLLLGRLPVPPADPAAVVRGTRGEGGAAAVSTVAYRDAAGRGWSAVVQGGQPVSWGLWQEPSLAPVLSFTSSGGWAVLVDHRKNVQVRWREAVREPLGRLVPMSPRADYREGGCLTVR